MTHVEGQPPLVWIERARGGDAAAFSTVIRHYERSALAIAYGVLGDSSRASDVVQDAMLRAWQRLGELKEPDKFGGWLGRMVRNLAIDARRRSTVMRLVDDTTAARRADPADGALRREQSEQINAALAGLDELTRSAVMLRYFEDLSSKEIGELLDLSPAAVDMRLSRARTELREKLAGQSPKSVRPTGRGG